METSRKIPMGKLSENAERIWKVLSHIPEGAAVIKLERITGLHKSWIYEALRELESNGFVVHKKRLYIPKARKTPPVRQLSKSERQKREARAETYALAKILPSLKPLADLFKTQEKIEKEFGSE
jgi:hypothetical protein